MLTELRNLAKAYKAEEKDYQHRIESQLKDLQQYQTILNQKKATEASIKELEQQNSQYNNQISEQEQLVKELKVKVKNYQEEKQRLAELEIEDRENRHQIKSLTNNIGFANA